MNLVDALLGAHRESDALALWTQEAKHSFRDVNRAVEQVGAFLLQRGVHPGERVGVFSENSLFSVAAYLGILRAGAVAVPMGSNLSVEHTRFIIKSTEMRLAFVQVLAWEESGGRFDDLATVVLDGEVTERQGGPARVPFAEALAARPAGPWPEVDARKDLAVLLFTSGSTSQPRGVMLTHQNILANTESILLSAPLEPSDRVMVVLPFYYTFGASLLHTHLKAGSSLVIDRRFMFPDKVVARMKETACTGFAGVPSHFQILLRRSKFKASPPDLKWVKQAGGKLATHFIAELVTALPQAKIFIMYGATEATARISCLPPELLATKLGSIGKGIPGVKVTVEDETGKPVAVGEVGEIVAQGDNIAQGYFQAPEDTAQTFRGGRLHTGDLARVDEDGFIFVVDRAKDFLKVGGNRTSALGLEETLLKCPEVVEVAVLGIPDELLGEAVAALVVPRVPGDTGAIAVLQAFAEANLAPQLVPKKIVLLGALPKTAAGKLQRKALRALLEPAPPAPR
jgi:long-chain acyl-CoA synthetase